MGKKALVVWGGWNGHEPDKVARIFGDMLAGGGFEIEISDTLDSLKDAGKLRQLHLIVPIWTMGRIENQCADAVSDAVSNGTGIAGCHGGMCDAFRDNTLWQFITGGQWVSHPGGDGVDFTVNIKDGPGSLLAGIKDFKIKTEHYYLHVDPAVKVHAASRFPVVRWLHSSNGDVDMPVVWTKRWGWGRVFYTSLGHHADVFNQKEPFEIMKRGLMWAAQGKDEAMEKGLSADSFRSDQKMF